MSSGPSISKGQQQFYQMVLSGVSPYEAYLKSFPNGGLSAVGYAKTVANKKQQEALGSLLGQGLGLAGGKYLYNNGADLLKKIFSGGQSYPSPTYDPVTGNLSFGGSGSSSSSLADALSQTPDTNAIGAYAPTTYDASSGTLTFGGSANDVANASNAINGAGDATSALSGPIQGVSVGGGLSDAANAASAANTASDAATAADAASNAQDIASVFGFAHPTGNQRATAIGQKGPVLGDITADQANIPASPAVSPTSFRPFAKVATRPTHQLQSTVAGPQIVQTPQSQQTFTPNQDAAQTPSSVAQGTNLGTALLPRGIQGMINNPTSNKTIAGNTILDSTGSNGLGFQASGTLGLANATQHGGDGAATSGAELGTAVLPGIGTAVGWGLGSLGKALGLFGETKGQQDRNAWADLINSGVTGAAKAYNGMHPQGDTHTWTSANGAPYAGQEWNFTDALNMAKADPAQFRNVYGNLATYGNNWANLTPTQQDNIVKANIDAGLYGSSAKGGIVITDPTQALKIKDQVLAQDPSSLKSYGQSYNDPNFWNQYMQNNPDALPGSTPVVAPLTSGANLGAMMSQTDSAFGSPSTYNGQPLVNNSWMNSTLPLYNWSWLNGGKGVV